jgi:hypothetical protein
MNRRSPSFETCFNAPSPDGAGRGAKIGSAPRSGKANGQGFINLMMHDLKRVAGFLERIMR